MKKRLVALIMVMALALSLVPVGATGVSKTNGDNGNSDTQIVNGGGTVYYDTNGHRVEGATELNDDAVVAMSKTVNTTEKENEFEVTLQIQTNQKVTELSSETPDAAVVLVIDLSASMTESGGQGKTRLQLVKEAAKQFIDEFASLSDGKSKCLLSIVTFGSHAVRSLEWTDVANETGRNEAKGTINDLRAYGSYDGTGGTNIEAGLMLARNNLSQGPDRNGVDYLYTVLLTDGQPTYHVDWDNTNETEWIWGDEGGGNYTTENDAKDVGDIAEDILQLSTQSRLYSICFGRTSYGNPVWNSKPFGNWKDANPKTTKQTTIGNWLRDFSSEAYNGGADADDLLDNFDSVLSQIALATQAFQVTDVMGTNMTFGEFKNKGGNLAEYDAGTNTLTWNVRNSPIDEDISSVTSDGKYATLGYTLKYTVTLDNLVNKQFTEEEPAQVNQKATLTYAFQDENENWHGDEEGNVLTGEFLVPTVKSHYGNLTFTKEGSDGKKLEGVTFTLTTADKPGWSMTEESNQDGKVSFTNIPSGHTYTLTEALPDQYEDQYTPISDASITVEYGNVTGSDGLFTREEDNLILTNAAKTGTLTVTKTVNGLENGVTLPEDFKIEVKNSDTVVKTLTTSNADSGTTYTWTVDDLAPGTYTVTESNYDVDGYTVVADGNDAHVKVTAGGTANADLTNTYKANTYGLTVEKTVTGMSGENVDDKQMAKPNDTLTYTITVTNTGNTERNDVTVTDTFMVGETTGELTFTDSQDDGYSIARNETTGAYTITIDSLGAAESESDSITITANYKVTADDAGKTITNTAVASDGDEDPNNDPKDETITIVENPDWTVTKTVDNATPNVDDTITYTITVRNTGNTTLNGLTVTDTMDDGRTVTWGTLPEGVTHIADTNNLSISGLASQTDVEITATYTVVATDAGATFQNTVTVSDGTTSETPDEPPEVTVSNPNVSINKTVSGMSGADNRAVEGDALTYTISVKNSGNTKLDVAVSDDMWTAGKVNSAELDGTTIDVSSGSYTISGLDVGESKSITYTYTVTAEDVTNGTIDNAATADINEDGTPDAKHEITTPTGEPSLIVDKTASEETVQVGAPITYTIEVKNDGYSVINNVVVRDTLWTEDTELTATGDVTGTYQVDEDGGKYYISEMKPGETLTITYTYTPTEAGTLTNKVEVTADNLPDGEKPSDEVTVEVTPEPVSSLTVNKSLAQVNGSDYTGGKVSVGDKLTYTIQVTNTGNTTLSRVTVEDSLWNDGDSIQVDGQLAYVADGGTYTIKHEIAPDDMVTITYTYIVLRSDAGDTLTNTATVTTDGGTTGEDTTETPVKPVPPIRPPVDPDKPELNTEDHYAYIVGYPDGNVKPEGNITRAEVATIFFRLLTDESRNEFWSQTNNYSDVSEDAWYNNAVSTLSNAGIIDGYEDGTFKPDGNITRAEFATIAVRFFEATYDGGDLFSDIAGHWAQDYINEAANAGIVDGYPDGTFQPQQLITRAEAMTMVNRTIDRHPDADHLLEDMITWPDNLETAWYYEQVQEATNSHAYTMNTDDEQNLYEIWTELLPNRDWSELEKAWSDANDGAGSGEVV